MRTLMEAFQYQRQLLPADFCLMKSVFAKFRATRLGSAQLRCFCAVPAPNSMTTQEQISCPSSKRSVLRSNGRARDKVSNVQLKENWLDSLSCPIPELPNGEISNVFRNNSGPQFVIGIDPDVSGALALLRTDDLGCSAQVFDSPHLKVLVNGRSRRRLDAKSIVELLKKFDAPVGTTAYVEQSIPYPQDGKQGWWGGGFGYGLWIGILVASGYSVVPVPALLWKNEFNLSGNRSNKEDSRDVASTLFPSMSSLLTRKKDHGRAEALLIAAYGKGLKMRTNSSCVLEELTS